MDQVRVDLSDSDMQFEVPIDEETSTSGKEAPTMQQQTMQRNQVHAGSEDFRHLSERDINKLCARVVIYGQKP